MKKILLGFVLLGTVILNGCGDKNTATDTQPADSSDTIVLVTGGSGLPYSLLDSDNNWTGIDAEMWAEIVKRTGWEIEVKRAAFDQLFGELDTGRADIAVNCFAITPARLDKYTASIPYYGDAQIITVGPASPIKTFDDLKGKKVGVTQGQASQSFLTEMAPKLGFELVVYDDSSVGYANLHLGRIDAMGGTVTLSSKYDKTLNAQFEMLEEKLYPNNVGYFFPKTDRGIELRDKINKVIQEMLNDGTIAEITKTWLFEDMTKYINNK